MDSARHGDRPILTVQRAFLVSVLAGFSSRRSPARFAAIALIALAGALSFAAPVGSANAQSTDPVASSPSSEPAVAVETPNPTTSTPEVKPRRRDTAAPVRESRRAKASARTPSPAPVPVRPADLTDLNAWLRYKVLARQISLPLEARLFYRRAMVARQSGTFEDAVTLMRGAAELDPTFADPHLTLCSWYLFREPGQTLMHAAGLVELAKQSFALQLGLAANGGFLLANALLFGLLATGFLIVMLRNHELRHPLQEFLARSVGSRWARGWPYVFLAIPYVAGLGLALPTVFYLGLLWPASKARERALFVALVVALLALPWLRVQADRFAGPLAEGEPPFHGVVALETLPYPPEQRDHMAALAASHPTEPLLQFGLGWVARQSGDLAAAEQSYREALRIGPASDRAMNNLANVLALTGRQDEALDFYRQAIEANPGNAAAYFNLAQIHTQRFDYHAASEALAHASALNFEMVKSQQAETIDGHIPLVDQWIAPRALWGVLLASHGRADAALPPLWRGRLEFGSRFAWALAIAAFAALVLGNWQHRTMPLRRCSNCDAVVCRRCAERRRELALCRACGAVEARAKAVDFARVLLADHLRKKQRPARLTRTALATLIPGFGMLAFRRVGAPLILLTASAAMVSLWSDAALPFAYEPRMMSFDHELPLALALAPWVLVYAWSLLGYFSEQARHDARTTVVPRPGRTRPAPPRYISAAA